MCFCWVIKDVWAGSCGCHRVFWENECSEKEANRKRLNHAGGRGSGRSGNRLTTGLRRGRSGWGAAAQVLNHLLLLLTLILFIPGTEKLKNLKEF